MATQYLQKHSSSTKEHLLGIAILMAFLLPHSNTFFLLVNPLLCLLLVFSFSKTRHWSPYVFMVVAPITLSLLLNMQIASPKALLSVFAILLYFLCFPFVGRVRIRNVYLYICLGYIIISQLVYVINVSFLTNFFDTMYPIGSDDSFSVGHMQDTITTDAIFNYRLGGLYHNANICAEYMCMLLAFFLVANQSESKKGVLMFSILAYASIMLTGSRTGFVVATLIVFVGLIRQHSYKGLVRYLFIAFVIIGAVYFLSKGVAFRGLDVESGFHNSANTKWDTFVYYITTENSIIALLFGHLDSSLFKGASYTIQGYFDCEYGDLIFRFGVVGFVSIILFWWMTIKRIDKNCWFYFLILLWCISSSVVAAYRAFFMFILLLSVIYSNKQMIIYKKQ